MSKEERSVPDKINTVDPEIDDSDLYHFPDLHMWVSVDGGCSEEEARKIAIRTIEEMEMDGFTRDANGHFIKPQEPPWYDPGRQEGGGRKKKYRWCEMAKLYRQLGRPLTAEETAQFEIKVDEGRHD